MSADRFTCPVCGYEELSEPPWAEDGSQESCPQCGIQFGYDDAAGGDPIKRREIHAEWRRRFLSGPGVAGLRQCSGRAP